MHGYSVPIIQQQQPSNQNYSSSSSYTTTTTTNYNSVPPPLPAQPPPSFGSSPDQTYSSQTTYSYIDPQNYTIKETYQSPPSNNGIQTYKSYTGSNYTSSDNNNLPNVQSSSPSQQPIQPASTQPPSNYINNPKTYIYDFATKTPISVLSPNTQPQTNASSNNYSSSYSYSSATNNNNNVPKQPLTYAEELRNSSEFFHIKVYQNTLYKLDNLFNIKLFFSLVHEPFDAYFPLGIHATNFTQQISYFHCVFTAQHQSKHMSSFDYVAFD